MLKYAQQLYGVDYDVTNHLSKFHKNLLSSLPKLNKFLQIETFGSMDSKEVLYVGVENLFDFRYQNIRDFVHRALNHLSQISPQIENITFTLHGTGYGLDEIESFESEIAGIVDALSQGKFPENLNKISIVEIDRNRSNRLDQALQKLFPNGSIIIDQGRLTQVKNSSTNHIKEAGVSSETKPLIFVAMPFDKSMDDVFHYGIQGVANDSGYLCERIDKVSFTGDILDRVKSRIRQADLVIAELTNANANVYLEVGYAWGCNKPTVLLVQEIENLKFDVINQRCLVYKGIIELEALLKKELSNLKYNQIA